VAKLVFLSAAMVGTPYYMAPEILAGTFGSTPTIHCDVYSFGLLVNELLDERIPYHERKDLTLKGLTEIVTKGEAQGVNRPILVSNKVAPTSFRDFIQKCWASKPLDRPTFEKMCDAKPQPWEEASTSHGAGGMSVNKELIDVFKDKNTLSLVEFGKKNGQNLEIRRSTFNGGCRSCQHSSSTSRLQLP